MSIGAPPPPPPPLPPLKNLYLEPSGPHQKFILKPPQPQNVPPPSDLSDTSPQLKILDSFPMYVHIDFCF